MTTANYQYKHILQTFLHFYASVRFSRFSNSSCDVWFRSFFESASTPACRVWPCCAFNVQHKWMDTEIMEQRFSGFVGGAMASLATQTITVPIDNVTQRLMVHRHDKHQRCAIVCSRQGDRNDGALHFSSCGNAGRGGGHSWSIGPQCVTQAPLRLLHHDGGVQQGRPPRLLPGLRGILDDARPRRRAVLVRVSPHKSAAPAGCRCGVERHSTKGVDIDIWRA